MIRGARPTQGPGGVNAPRSSSFGTETDGWVEGPAEGGRAAAWQEIAAGAIGPAGTSEQVKGSRGHLQVCCAWAGTHLDLSKQEEQAGRASGHIDVLCLNLWFVCLFSCCILSVREYLLKCV